MSDTNEIVSPKGLTLPNALRRLEEIPESMRPTNPEHIIASLWEKVNTRDPALNSGSVPLDGILHECSEKCGKGKMVVGHLLIAMKKSPRGIFGSQLL